MLFSHVNERLIVGFVLYCSYSNGSTFVCIRFRSLCFELMCGCNNTSGLHVKCFLSHLGFFFFFFCWTCAHKERKIEYLNK
jgi:hypothetical protein